LLSKITIAYNVLAMLVLVPFLGLAGAVLARGSAVALKNAFIWWHVRGRAVWGNAASFLVSGIVLWGAVVLACLAIKAAVPAPAILQLGIGAMLCTGALLIYVRTPAISASDRGILASLFHGREARALERLGVLRPLSNGSVAS